MFTKRTDTERPNRMVVYFILSSVITILAVLLFLERKKRRTIALELQQRLEDESTGKLSSNALSNDHTSDRSSQSVPYGIAFQRDGESSGFEITTPSKRYMQSKSWRNLDLSTSSKEWLTPFLSAASDALKIPLIGTLASTRTFRIVFNGPGDLMRSRSGEGFRSILVDRNSRHINSHGTLVPTGESAQNFLFIWECAAFVVGRKYLSDISNSLMQLEVGIADVKAFLENERVGALQAYCGALTNVARALLANPSFLYRNLSQQHSIEQIDLLANSVARSCLLDLETIKANLLRMGPLSAIFDADLTALTLEGNKTAYTIKCAAFALSLRIYCSELLDSYMEDSVIKSQRLQDVKKLLDDFTASSGEILIKIEEKVETLSEVTSSEVTIKSKKARAKLHAQESLQEATLGLKIAKEDLEKATKVSSLLAVSQEQLEVVVVVDRQGRMIKADVPDVAFKNSASLESVEASIP